MNSYSAIDVSYLRQDKTIETILIKNEIGLEKVLFVYNYQGWFYRVFNNPIELMDFFDDRFEPEIYFEDEEELGKYLENFEINDYN